MTQTSPDAHQNAGRHSLRKPLRTGRQSPSPYRSTDAAWPRCSAASMTSTGTKEPSGRRPRTCGVSSPHFEQCTWRAAIARLQTLARRNSTQPTVVSLRHALNNREPQKGS